MNERHPATTGLLKWFDYQHLPPNLKQISSLCHGLAYDITDSLPDSPELTAGLRKLLEAKDCFVRAAVDAGRGD